MKIRFTFVFLLFAVSLSVSAQSIIDVQCINKLSDTRFVTLLSNNTIWWSVNGAGWQQLPVTGLPPGATIKMIDVYAKFSGSSKNTRLVAVLSDNTVWWYADGSNWEKVANDGLPRNANITMLKPYVKFSGLANTDTRFLVLLDDNTMWWYALNEPWKKVSADGLPSGMSITGLGTYQKMGMMGGETRYILTLADNSVWWYAEGKKWQRLEAAGLPADAIFKKFTAYMKIGAGAMLAGAAAYEGRLIAVLKDESIWWFAANGKAWKKLETGGLPAGYSIRNLEVYQKYPGMSDETRLIALLEDDSIWWFAENKGWTNLDTKKLTK